jgi:hypothetical protein
MGGELHPYMGEKLSHGVGSFPWQVTAPAATIPTVAHARMTAGPNGCDAPFLYTWSRKRLDVRVRLDGQRGLNANCEGRTDPIRVRRL